MTYTAETDAALAQMAHDFRVVQGQRDNAEDRAIKAELERDKWRKIAADAERDADEAEAELEELKALPRPLKPSEGYVETVRDYIREQAGVTLSRSLLREALAPEQPRPLTRDDITDEMLHRAEEAFMWNDTLSRRAALSAALVAALTEPPARPDWADATAVVATYNNRREELWAPAPDEGAGMWLNGDGALLTHWTALTDVTPLYPQGGKS